MPKRFNYDTNYCDRVAEGQTRSCQDLAAQENYKAKAAENPALPIYSKYYKRYAARVRSRQIKEADFKKWKFQALAKRDECSDGKITVEEYEYVSIVYFSVILKAPFTKCTLSIIKEHFQLPLFQTRYEELSKKPLTCGI